MQDELKELRFKRTIPIGDYKEKVNKDSFWILIWHGRSFLNNQKGLIYKEIYFINVPNKNYYISNWRGCQTVRLEIPEEKSCILPLGAIFDYKGSFVENISKNSVGLYERKVEVASEDYHNKNLRYKMQSTDFPSIQKEERDYIYAGAPYYFSTKKDYYEDTEISITTNFIFPIHVINSYFFYLSTLCVYQIVYDRVKYGFLKPTEYNEDIIIPFYGDIIRLEEAKLLGKYFFINGEKNIDYLKEIPINFFLELYNSRKYNRESQRIYMDGKIPFDYNVNFQVIGQYITEKGKREKTFLVYKILSFQLPQGVDKFTCKKYYFKNLHDTRSIDTDNEEISLYVNKKTSSKSANFESGNMEGETNHNHDIIPITDPTLNDCFFDSPESELIEKEDQSEKYKGLTQHIKNDIESLSLDQINHDSSSLIARVNARREISERNPHFQIFQKVMNRIGSTSGFTFQYLKIGKAEEDSVFSELPLSRKHVIIASIEYSYRHYCIVDFGGGKVIPIFRNNDSSIGFNLVDDRVLEDVFYFMKYQDYNWKACSDQLSENFDLYMLNSLNHSQNTVSEDEAIKHLYKRVIDRIRNDQKLTSSLNQKGNSPSDLM